MGLFLYECNKIKIGVSSLITSKQPPEQQRTSFSFFPWLPEWQIKEWYITAIFYLQYFTQQRASDLCATATRAQNNTFNNVCKHKDTFLLHNISAVQTHKDTDLVRSDSDEEQHTSVTSVRWMTTAKFVS